MERISQTDGRTLIWRVVSIVLAASLCLAVTLPFLNSLNAGKYNAKVNVGDKVTEFKDLRGVDGKPHGLADYQDKTVVVVAFICNSCPVSESYQQRIIDFASKYADKKVSLVAVNASKLEEDSFAHMVDQAAKQKFNFPYLRDETQALGRSLGATITPEFFVLNKERRIVYMGALDNNNVAAKVTERYVEDAVNALLAGRTPLVSETRPRGCSVIYER